MRTIPFPRITDLADRIQWARVRVGLPSTTLGTKAGLSHAAVPLLENGTSKTMEASTAFRLASVMALPGEEVADMALWLVCGHRDPLDLPNLARERSANKARAAKPRVRHYEVEKEPEEVPSE